jgi:FkbM family methyltransferase
MIIVDDHTIDERFLKDGWIIDAGCRRFSLSKAFPNQKVYAIDIENFTDVPPNTRFVNAALTNNPGKWDAYFFGDGSANFLKGINEPPGNTEDRPCETKSIDCITLDNIYSEIGTDIDLLKADIEGFEYFVFKDFKPIPKMISIETHQHCHEILHNECWPDVFEKLCKDYHCTLHIHDWPKYLFMDCLFIRKDLL